MAIAIRKFYLNMTMDQNFSPLGRFLKDPKILKFPRTVQLQQLNRRCNNRGKNPRSSGQKWILFIKALGQVGFYVDGAINWDIAALVGAFGLTLLLSQVLSSQDAYESTAINSNKITPVMITGMFFSTTCRSFTIYGCC